MNYSVAEKKDPRNPGKEGMYYAHVRTRGVLDKDGLIDRIDRRGSVGKPDIVSVLINLEDIVTDALCNGSVLINLEDIVTDALCNGEIVRLGELGSLSLSVSSQGCKRKEDFCGKNITKVRTIFKEGKTLKRGIACLHFKKVE